MNDQTMIGRARMPEYLGATPQTIRPTGSSLVAVEERLMQMLERTLKTHNILDSFNSRVLGINSQPTPPQGQTSTTEIPPLMVRIHQLLSALDSEIHKLSVTVERTTEL